MLGYPMDADPYAPPATAEPQAAQSTRMWRVEGEAVLARDGAVLAQVDLNSGEREEDMQSIVRVHHFVSLTNFIILSAVGAMVLGAGAIHIRGIKLYMLLGVIFVAQSFWQRGRAAAGKVSSRVAVREFLDLATVEGRVKRRKMRIVMALVIVMLVGLVPVLSPPASLAEFLTQVMVAFAPGFTALAGVGIWALLDGPKAKYRSAGRGWVRIAPVHPRALEFLSDLEERETAAAGPLRLVFAHYLHRYPLRTLLSWANSPREILGMLAIKLHRLEAQEYHAAAPPVARTALCEPVQQALGVWHARHPDWQIVECHVLDNPSATFELHLALLACEGLTHHLWLSRIWMPGKPHFGKVRVTFGTWLADGSLVETHDHATFNLGHPEIRGWRARGTPEAILRAHLCRCAGEPIDPPVSPAELIKRAAAQREKVRLRLVELGYQSAPH
jgi:hypothetical protein